ncbi:N-acetylmuramoyl-L-alanine amidase [Profundibacterium mesophilum KAUST100406-0324]|uniref:N-acetylmuramoyl-L-alanine amidase n=2 Tax=Profundibacterium TaxID=1258570 RepID=A0A921NVM4_9RHOB|nr:N-acetylmuramoyl-L-alanine amidase [Profundibacterium mesophilum KAUST100406-0324]
MRLEHHHIASIPMTPARNIGGPIVPELVVVHDTAGRLEAGNAARYLAQNDAGVSVHFVVERGGEIVQQVPTNRRAGHAGRSHYHGRRGVNDFSIGIEIVNPGKLYDNEAYGIRAAQTPEHGAGLWMDYTPEQITAVIGLLGALFAGIPTLKDIRAHWYVSPGRKIDANPLFPLEAIRARILGREEPGDIPPPEGFDHAAGDALVQVRAHSGLNLRRWPSFNPNVIGLIPDEPEGKQMFHDSKSIFASKTIWGGGAALAAGALGLLGYAVSPADQAALVRVALDLVRRRRDLRPDQGVQAHQVSPWDCIGRR